MIETWKPIKDFEALYEVSDQGRVRSLDRQRWCIGRDDIWRTRIVKGRILKGCRKGNVMTVKLRDCERLEVRRIDHVMTDAFGGS